jgi:hypothetical protein
METQMPTRPVERELPRLLPRLPLLELELVLQPGLSSSLVLALRTPTALLGAVGSRAGSALEQLSHKNGMEDVGSVMRSLTITRQKLS